MDQIFCAIAPQLVTSVLAWTIKNDCLPAAVGPKKILTGLDGLKQSLDTPMYGIEPYRLLQHLFTQNNINREKLVSWQGRQSCSYCDLTFCNPPIPPSSTDFYLSIYTRVLKVCQLKQLAEQVSQSVSAIYQRTYRILLFLQKFFLDQAHRIQYQVNRAWKTMSVKTDCLVCDRWR